MTVQWADVLCGHAKYANNLLSIDQAQFRLVMLQGCTTILFFFAPANSGLHLVMLNN